MTTIKQLKNANSIEDLEKLNIGRMTYDISPRGGNLGFLSEDVSKHFGVNADLLPRYCGAYCNYLGGGIRGSIMTSGAGFDKMAKRKARLITELQLACKRAYETAENEQYMNDEEDENGEINWDAKATQMARKAGVASAY